MKTLSLTQTKLIAHLVTFIICFVIISIASETINPLNFCEGGLFFIAFMQFMTFFGLTSTYNK